MTHITDGCVIGKHADMGRARRKEMGAAQSTWDSEGGSPECEPTAGEGESAPGGAEGSPSDADSVRPLNPISSAL
jgi:hypothetical protein